jgi:hypothetical protein
MIQKIDLGRDCPLLVAGSLDGGVEKTCGSPKVVASLQGTKESLNETEKY